ncbi:MAG: T9SS C-terminal target domain-containing protein [Ignavibacteriae bacterium]|nr:MAG: T9SS C-terminal target domain-containing protein [Ignavibacteriota bacterium]
MKSLTILTLLLSSLISGLFSQVVNNSLIITDNTSIGVDTLWFGLDSAATDGIDATLGEYQLPPPPPTGIFDCRFVGEDISIPQMGQGMSLDYRQGTSIYVGNRLHELKFQKGTGASVTLRWNLPSGITGKLTDLVGGVIVNDTMVGNGNVNITNGAINKLYMRIYYNLAPPPPPAPRLILPLNGAVCVSLTPLLDWADTTSALYYRVEVSTSPAFTTVADSATSVNSQYTIPSGKLLNNTLYYWHAASVGVGGSSWSSSRSFTTTTVSFSAVPQLLTPKDDSTGISLTPLLDWNNLTGAISYKVEISVDSLFSSIADSATTTLSQYTISAGKLSIGTTYYWRVFGKNACNTSSPSVVWSFTTIVNPPPAPRLILPLNGAACVSLTPLLDWADTTGAINYRVEVSTSPTFATIADSATITNSQYTVPVGKLLNNTLYYWHAASVNAGGSSWSTSRSFTTTTVILPNPPVLFQPINGAIAQPLTPTLIWSKLTGAIRYFVQLSTDSTFSVITDSATVTDSFYTVPSGKLANHVVYYWRVTGKNTCNTSPTTNTWHFETEYEGIEQISNIIPKEFKLYNNYPNPFNPITRIPFDIPRKSFVSLKIWDIMGREIMTLINEEMHAGKYEYEFYAPSISSGIYFYRLESSDYVSIKRMILLK